MREVPVDPVLEVLLLPDLVCDAEAAIVDRTVRLPAAGVLTDGERPPLFGGGCEILEEMLPDLAQDLGIAPAPPSQIGASPQRAVYTYVRA